MSYNNHSNAEKCPFDDVIIAVLAYVACETYAMNKSTLCLLYKFKDTFHSSYVDTHIFMCK